MKTTTTKRPGRLLKRACRFIPGGVNSPVRAFHAVGGEPPFITRGHGSFVYDRDGKRYIDYLASWGPLILGHTPPAIIRAVEQAARRGTTFGAATEGEVKLAQLICEMVRGVEQVRLVSSGTEALMSAVRLARAFTRRDRIVKFRGGYHGHADSFLVAAGSGAATFGHPSSPGVPKALARLTSVIAYNDIPAFKEFMARHGRSIAAVFVEPVAANAGVIPPNPGFLETLRRETRRYGALLVFDEVVTGFRVGLGGAQELFGIDPDLTCLGKIVGGGLPLAAFGGRRRIMQMLSPIGPVYQAGTLSGNPLAVAAGLTALQLLRAHPPYAKLEKQTAWLTRGLSGILTDAGIPHRINRVGSMFTVFFCGGPVESFSDAAQSDTRRFAAFHRAMLRNGIYVPPAQFEAWFVSATHDSRIIDETLTRARKAIREIKGGHVPCSV